MLPLLLFILVVVLGSLTLIFSTITVLALKSLFINGLNGGDVFAFVLSGFMTGCLLINIYFACCLLQEPTNG